MIPASRRSGGPGPTLVCHPGGPGFSARAFGDVAGLARELDVVLVDPRGTGLTPRPDDPRAYRIEDYVADLDELRADLGLARLNLLGWSHGGVVAMAYAAEHADRVERLVLVATLTRFAADQEEAMVAAMERRADEPWYADAVAAVATEQAGDFASDEELEALVNREFPLYFARFGEAERAYLDAVREPPNADTLQLFNREIFPSFDLRPRLGRITARTLVLVGEEDFITGPLCAAEIEAGIHGARTVAIPGAGHFLFHEARERVREEVLRFLTTP